MNRSLAKIKLYKHRLEIGRGLMTVAADKMTARFDIETPAYEVGSWQNAAAFPEPVENPNMISQSSIAQRVEQINLQILSTVDSTNLTQVGGNSLPITPTHQRPAIENLREKVQDQKILESLSHIQLQLAIAVQIFRPTAIQLLQGKQEALAAIKKIFNMKSAPLLQSIREGKTSATTALPKEKISNDENS